jgi:hypothetical protein
LDKEYQTAYKDWEGKTQKNEKTDAELHVSSNSTQKIYVMGSSVTFQWTANSDNNLNIYTANSGSTVTFKERKK